MKQRTTERDKDLPLHTKYRPPTLDEIVGNEATIAALKSILERESGAVRTFLFYGPKGSGKTTLARIVGSESDCEERNIVELDNADLRGIDHVRTIKEACRHKPMLGGNKCFILDEAHKFTNDAQNALLKLLEDPPKHIRIVLCTTDPEKLLKTVRSRCTPFVVAPLRRQQMIKLLKFVCDEEKCDIDEKLLMKISECSEGCPRDALVMLDKIIDIEDEKMAEQTILSMSIDESTVIELCTELLKSKPKWEAVAKIITGMSDEPEKIRYGVLTYMSKVLLSKESDRAAHIINLFEESWMYSGKASLIQRCYLACK